MYKNSFLPVLFDYSKPITRRQFWACLLFAFLFLNTTALGLMDNVLYKTLVADSGFNYQIINFLQIIYSSVSKIISFLPIAAAFAVVIVTYKRSKTLNFSNAKSVFFAILVYLGFFLLNAIFAYLLQAAMDERHFEQPSPPNFYSNVIPALMIISAVFVVCAIAVAAFLSKETEIDDREPSSYYSSVDCIFGLIKLELAIVFASVVLGFVYAKIIHYLIFLNIGVLILTFCYIYYFVKIIKERGIDADVKSKYFFIPMIIVYCITICYFIFYLFSYAGSEIFSFKPITALIVNKICLTATVLFRILLCTWIILPTKREE